MKTYYVSMLLAFVLCACSSLKQGVYGDMNTPSLGAIGKQDKSLLNTNFKQVGEPVLTDGIVLSVRSIPFTKSSFKNYSNFVTKRGEKVHLKYVDSLPVKPKYLRFEIKDKIGLKTLLNETKNAEVRSYLTKDADCRIVSSMSIQMNEMEADFYLNAEGLFLTTDTNGLLRIQLVNGKDKKLVNLPKNQAFDYDVMGFCWGENRYGQARIETLNAGGSCPEGTEKNAQKLDGQLTLLKL